MLIPIFGNLDVLNGGLPQRDEMVYTYRVCRCGSATVHGQSNNRRKTMAKKSKKSSVEVKSGGSVWDRLPRAQSKNKAGTKANEPEPTKGNGKRNAFTKPQTLANRIRVASTDGKTDARAYAESLVAEYREPIGEIVAEIGESLEVGVQLGEFAKTVFKIYFEHWDGKLSGVRSTACHKEVLKAGGTVYKKELRNTDNSVDNFINAMVERKLFSSMISGFGRTVWPYGHRPERAAKSMSELWTE